MIYRNKNAILAGSVAAVLLSSNTVFAAGFEKSVLWSGKYAGQGNAAVSSASGAEALYFNPAGLAGAAGTQLSLNVSPTQSQFNGPIFTDNESFESEKALSPIFGALASYGINEKLTVGVGAYVVAGANAEYLDTETAGGTLELSPKTQLSALEYSAGIGYEVMPGLKLGASWRMTQVSAEITTVNTQTGPLATLTTESALSGLKATNSSGYRVGAQYEASDKSWGLGVSYRSAVDFDAEGTATSTLFNGTEINTDAAVTVSSTLPYAVSMGGNYAVTSSLRGVLEYVWTNYGAVDRLNIDGVAIDAGAAGANPEIALNDLELGFANQTNLRAGLIYDAGNSLVYRAGYVYTTQVTPANRARPTLAPPGVGHTFTLGATMALSQSMELNAAGEYSATSGSGADDATLGDYSASAIALHTGLSYRF